MSGLATNDFLDQFGVSPVDQHPLADLRADDVDHAHDVAFLRFGSPSADQVRADGHGVNMGYVAVQDVRAVAQLSELLRGGWGRGIVRRAQSLCAGPGPADYR